MHLGDIRDLRIVMNELGSLLTGIFSFFRGLFQSVLAAVRWVASFFYAAFYSILKVKMAVRVVALLLAVVLWHDNNKKYELSRDYYEFAIQQGLKSDNLYVKKKAEEELRKFNKSSR